MCYLIQPNSLSMWFMFPAMRDRLSVQTPQSGLLHCVPHGKPACNLLGLATFTPALKGLSPVGTVIVLTYIHHSRHTQCIRGIRENIRGRIRSLILTGKFKFWRNLAEQFDLKACKKVFFPKFFNKTAWCKVAERNDKRPD
jgi:hypothetical protein